MSNQWSVVRGVAATVGVVVAGALLVSSLGDDSSEPTTEATTTTREPSGSESSPGSSTDTSNPVDDLTADDVLGRWTILAAGGEVMLPDKGGYLDFGEEAVLSGATGCNGLVGTWQVPAGGGLVLGELGRDNKTCPQPVMDQEERIWAALNASADIRWAGATAEILDAGGTVVMTIEPT